MVHQQALAFIVSLGAGMMTGIIFDIYQVIRRLLGLKKVGTVIGDVLIWLVITACTFCLLIVGNWAELRLYVFIAILFGLIVYLRLCSRWVQILVLKFINLLHWTIRILIKSIVFPCQQLIKLLYFPAAALKFSCLLIMRLVEYLLSYPYLGIRSLVRRGKQPPPM